ncbi:MAG: hypothetical protein ABUJ92_00530 [Desulfobacterales bacterium]
MNQCVGVYPSETIDMVRYDSKGIEVIQLNSAFGEQIVVELSPQWLQSFEYTVDNTDLNENLVTGSGAVTQANAMAVISTGITTGSESRLKSAHHARYKAGMGGVVRFSAKFTAPVAGTWQIAGLVDERGTSEEFKNGYTIGYHGTDFAVMRFQNDVLFEVLRDDWDDPLDGTGPSGVTYSDVELANICVFYIQYQYLGGGPQYYWTEHPSTGVPFKFHTVPYAGLYSSPSVHNPNFHMTLYANNVATTTDLTVSCGSYGYFIEGRTELVEFHQPQFSTGGVQKTGITTEVAIVTLRNKSTYAGKINYIDIILERSGGSIEASGANNLGQVRLIKNATLGGTPVWNDVNTTNSVVEIDIAGTTVTGGRHLVGFPLAGKNDKTFENLIPYKFIIHPGDTVTVAGASAASATILSGELWKELL